MPTTPDPRERRSFPREGLTLLLDAEGLEIRVDDYHPMPLKLSWSLIEELRGAAQGGRAAQQGG